MSQIAFWKQLLYLIEDSPRIRVHRRVFKSISRKRLRCNSSWLLGLSVVTVMLFWNWRLLLATSVGISLMLGVYFLQDLNWRLYWKSWQRFFSGSNRQLTIAVASGAIATLGTYLIVSLWGEIENHWLATGLTLQGLGTLVTVGLLTWMILNQSSNQESSKFEQLLTDLTAIDPVKRLIAVRQLHHLVTQGHLPNSYRHQLVEYFRLMLSVEQESLIRDAVLESLQTWEPNQIKSEIKQPLQIPLDVKVMG